MPSSELLSPRYHSSYRDVKLRLSWMNEDIECYRGAHLYEPSCYDTDRMAATKSRLSQTIVKDNVMLKKILVDKLGTIDKSRKISRRNLYMERLEFLDEMKFSYRPCKSRCTTQSLYRQKKQSTNIARGNAKRSDSKRLWKSSDCMRLPPVKCREDGSDESDAESDVITSSLSSFTVAEPPRFTTPCSLSEAGKALDKCDTYIQTFLRTVKKRFNLGQSSVSTSKGDNASKTSFEDSQKVSAKPSIPDDITRKEVEEGKPTNPSVPEITVSKAERAESDNNSLPVQHRSLHVVTPRLNHVISPRPPRRPSLPPLSARKDNADPTTSSPNAGTTKSSPNNGKPYLVIPQLPPR